MRHLPSSFLLCALIVVMGIWAMLPAHAPQALGSPESNANAHVVFAYRAHADLCAEWHTGFVARGLNANDADYVAHTLGCVAPWGVWHRDSSRCMWLAYREALYATPRHPYTYAHIGTHGCVLEEDGTWSNE